MKTPSTWAVSIIEGRDALVDTVDAFGVGPAIRSQFPAAAVEPEAEHAAAHNALAFKFA
jgi:hypothetical protein